MRFAGLIVAIILAAVAAVIVLRSSNTPPPTAAAPAISPIGDTSKTANIYVATRGIPVGTTITADMVTTQAWPQHLMLEGFVSADKNASAVVGTIARGTFQAQEPILASKLANANDPNFLAGALPKGMRVITIATNEIEGVAGFVFPGDHVDILLTHEMERSGSSGMRKPAIVTETLLNNTLVVAVDQRASSAGAMDKEGKLVIPRSVSLMVTPADAQKLRLGAKAGTLTMALRGIIDHESVDPLVITSIGDISHYQQAGDESGGILVLRGAPGDKKEVANRAEAAFANSPLPGR